ncbi:HAD-IA family hydrolase [Candidatus Woesearchaeota archaeon]|nr:HAD-IA family hydrolase [Candidatus Woesearchaeota archaeon]
MGKLKKPFIDKVLAEFNVKPEEVLFVDDFPGNVEKAKLFGMNAIQFTELNELKQYLKLS